MSDSIRESIYEAIASIRLIDPHTHINPHAAGSTTLADLLGYHYYTELAHSAGMPKQQIEEPGIGPRELVRRLVENLSPLENTAQYRWLVEICRMFFGFDGDRIDASNWESLYDTAETQMASADWAQMVLDQSNVEAVFLTNDFDDDLAGFDTDTYIPCLRTDDLVFHLAKPEVRQRLAGCSGIELDGSLASLRASLRQRFQHFVARGARACAISLPPTFQPAPVSDGRAATALDQVLRRGVLADDSHKQALSRRVFWTLAELCDEFGLPFDLMIGVNRGVYANGVYQGQDLYDSRVSLIQYRELFNAFPDVKFPVSVLASVTNQELVSYAWIFPNVITNGHWWYSNTPSFIARDAAARLEAVPQTKQIGYYSDAYKLEFVWPKFDMYRHVLSGVLADHFVGSCGWSEERAVALGRRVLRDNVDEIFPRPTKQPERVDPLADTWTDDDSGISLGSIGSAGAAAIGAAGILGGNDSPTSPSSESDRMTALPSDAGSSETVAIDDDDDEDGLADFATVSEADETIRIDEDDASEVDPIVDSLNPLMDLDPLPSEDEIQSAEVDDVELRDTSSQRTAPDAESIASELDDQPLDLGDMFADDDGPQASVEDGPQIKQLRGEESFNPDDESLKLTPDPLTGELTFAVGDDEEIADPNATLEIKDDDEQKPS
ncbi:glucuronate isomerase [Rubripirellula lacrimiformis]|uniref:Glucuronate isomerase n=1 Tax=Rubripirellula lacrimiformis TaxID=1930273 RepID=A0A517N5X8_9BACT|nr:glucuronate isomerase [Rubripirellula lacrimiformis]QDT02549.1 glucuronate isomerase [Rubripirellula lacrimiformis]